MAIRRFYRFDGIVLQVGVYSRLLFLPDGAALDGSPGSRLLQPRPGASTRLTQLSEVSEVGGPFETSVRFVKKAAGSKSEAHRAESGSGVLGKGACCPLPTS